MASELSKFEAKMKCLGFIKESQTVQKRDPIFDESPDKKKGKKSKLKRALPVIEQSIEERAALLGIYELE